MRYLIVLLFIGAAVGHPPYAEGGRNGSPNLHSHEGSAKFSQGFDVGLVAVSDEDRHFEIDDDYDSLEAPIKLTSDNVGARLSTIPQDSLEFDITEPFNGFRPAVPVNFISNFQANDQTHLDSSIVGDELGSGPIGSFGTPVGQVGQIGQGNVHRNGNGLSAGFPPVYDGRNGGQQSVNGVTGGLLTTHGVGRDSHQVSDGFSGELSIVNGRNNNRQENIRFNGNPQSIYRENQGSGLLSSAHPSSDENLSLPPHRVEDRFPQPPHQSSVDRFPQPSHQSSEDRFPQPSQQGSGDRFPQPSHQSSEDRFPQPSYQSGENRFPQPHQQGSEDRFPQPSRQGSEERFPQPSHQSNEDRFPQPAYQSGEDRFPQPSRQGSEDRFPHLSQQSSENRFPQPSKQGSQERFPHPSQQSNEDKFPQSSRQGSQERFPHPSQQSSEDRFPHSSQQSSEDRFPHPSQQSSEDRFPQPPQQGSQERFPHSSQQSSEDRFPQPTQQGSQERFPHPSRQGSEDVFPDLTESVCEKGLVESLAGECVEPEIIRNLYVYQEPPFDKRFTGSTEVPTPKIKYNVVVINSADGAKGGDPIIIPPPREQTLVLVLDKDEQGDKRIIEIPEGPSIDPEVFFVKYKEGENPQLPGGIDLETALLGTDSLDGFSEQSGDGLGQILNGESEIRDEQFSREEIELSGVAPLSHGSQQTSPQTSPQINNGYSVPSNIQDTQIRNQPPTQANRAQTQSSGNHVKQHGVTSGNFNLQRVNGFPHSQEESSTSFLQQTSVPREGPSSFVSSNIGDSFENGNGLKYSPPQQQFNSNAGSY